MARCDRTSGPLNLPELRKEQRRVTALLNQESLHHIIWKRALTRPGEGLISRKTSKNLILENVGLLIPGRGPENRKQELNGSQNKFPRVSKNKHPPAPSSSGEVTLGPNSAKKVDGRNDPDKLPSINCAPYEETFDEAFENPNGEDGTDEDKESLHRTDAFLFPAEHRQESSDSSVSNLSTLQRFYGLHITDLKTQPTPEANREISNVTNQLLSESRDENNETINRSPESLQISNNKPGSSSVLQYSKLDADSTKSTSMGKILPLDGSDSVPDLPVIKTVGNSEIVPPVVVVSSTTIHSKWKDSEGSKWEEGEVETPASMHFIPPKFEEKRKWKFDIGEMTRAFVFSYFDHSQTPAMANKTRTKRKSFPLI